MTQAQRIIRGLSAAVIADELGVHRNAVYDAASKGVFPPSWYPMVRDLCAAWEIDCPMEAFNFRRSASHKFQSQNVTEITPPEKLGAAS